MYGGAHYNLRTQAAEAGRWQVPGQIGMLHRESQATVSYKETSCFKNGSGVGGGGSYYFLCISHSPLNVTVLMSSSLSLSLLAQSLTPYIHIGSLTL